MNYLKFYEPTLGQMIEFLSFQDTYRYDRDLRIALKIASFGNNNLFRSLVKTNCVFRLKDILDNKLDLFSFALESCADVNKIDFGVTDELARRMLHGVDTKDLIRLTMLAAAGADVSMESTGYADIFSKKDLKRYWDHACSRESVEKVSFGRIKNRALEISMAMQDLELPAWCMIRILIHVGEPFSRSARLRDVWTLATKVKHYKD